MRTHRGIAGVVVTALAATLLAATAGSAGASAGQEADFVRKINAERTSRGLSALTVRSDLVAVARRHSARMAAKGTIWHNPSLGEEVGGNWTTLGENVGMGPSVESLHKAFMNSEGHRENILYPSFNEIGVGIVVDDGTIYVTEVFAVRTSSGSSASSSGSSSSTYTAAAVAGPVAPAPKPKPKPKPKPRTVSHLVAMVGLDAENVDAATGNAMSSR
jgi:hypothetical protein